MVIHGACAVLANPRHLSFGTTQIRHIMQKQDIAATGHHITPANAQYDARAVILGTACHHSPAHYQLIL